MSLDVNILVNGKKCKQYHHEGKIYIEAKPQSEYSIEIKNNRSPRVLAVCSVDGLNVISGVQASDNDPGYVIPGYSSQKIDGYRVDNDTVAKFVFDKKINSYATSKQDGSDVNVGVIGCIIYNEKVKETYSIDWSNFKYPTPVAPNPMYPQTYPCNPKWSYDDYKITCSTQTKLNSDNATQMDAYHDNSCVLRSVNCSNGQNNWDMGTAFGKAKESKVVETEFEKSTIALTIDIYYASRESLINMGIPIDNKQQITFPKSFPNKFAQPPKGWKP